MFILILYTIDASPGFFKCQMNDEQIRSVSILSLIDGKKKKIETWIDKNGKKWKVVALFFSIFQL